MTSTTPPSPAAPPVASLSLRERIAASRQQFSRVWALSSPFFSSKDKWKARGLLAVIVALNLAMVYMNVLFNDWNKLFYDALQEKNAQVFWEQLGRFSYLAFGFIVIAVYKFYLTQLLEVRWRSWMTSQYLQRWLQGQVFYRLELARFDPKFAGTLPDNPDQRIQEDIGQFTSLTISLCMGLLNSVVTLASFVGILWTLSGSFSFSYAGSEYLVPGFMVWMALVYSLAGSVITHYLGRPQIGLNFEQQRLEAEFRHRMVRVREFSESIALDRGEAVEGAQLQSRFGRVLGNYMELIRAQKRLIWFTSFFGQAAVVFPFVVAAPRFFSGAIQLGDLMQISTAFGQVQGSLSWLVDSYSSLANWRATTDRLTSFETAFRTLSSHESTALLPEDSGRGVQASNLHLQLPDGSVLLDQTGLQVDAGDRILLQGPSGSGKSTLFRSLAGIWPYASGEIRRAADVMFLPQRPYLPDGRLRDALAYPQDAGDFEDAELKQALKDVDLTGLVEQLDATGAWSKSLSGGEQQRLAVARAVLRKPRWIFADEATSALDEATQQTVYEQLRALAACRNGALVSIAHRPALGDFHDTVWTLQAQPAGSEARYTLTALKGSRSS
jgi:vitamin B12/bleomycin/antimicrobial peptide transport system ATP-binding/permease protein